MLSIIMPIYNTPENYLRKSIESVINQTKKDIEIILINDGSSKKVEDVCVEYANKDNRIILINQENQGESVARNVGIEKASSNYITFVDSDDWIEEDLYDNMCQYLKEETDIVIFDCYVHYKNKKIKNHFYNKEGFLSKEDKEEIQLQNIEKGTTKYYPPGCNISVVWAKIYNKNFIMKNNLKFIPGIVRMPDALFNMEAFEKANKILYTQKCLYHYNKNDFSICQKYEPNTIKYFERYFEFVEKYIKKYQKGQKFIDTLNIKKVTSIDNYMNNYFFHKDNVNNKLQMEKEFAKLLSEEQYKKAFKMVKKEYLSTYSKMLLRYSIKRNIRKLRILNKCKNIMALISLTK